MLTAACCASAGLVGLTYWFWHWYDSIHLLDEKDRRMGYFFPVVLVLSAAVGWLWIAVIRHEEFEPVHGAIVFAGGYSIFGVIAVASWRKARIERLRAEEKASKEFERWVKSGDDE